MRTMVSIKEKGDKRRMGLNGGATSRSNFSRREGEWDILLWRSPWEGGESASNVRWTKGGLVDSMPQIGCQGVRESKKLQTSYVQSAQLIVEGGSCRVTSEAWNFVEGAKRIFPPLRRTKRGFRFAIRQLNAKDGRSDWASKEQQSKPNSGTSLHSAEEGCPLKA